MKKLVVPNPDKHEYVLGIDFGHGETSAAYCALEWNKPKGQRQDQATDVDIDSAARLKVIPSAICHANGQLYIGAEAFEHMTDNEGIRICFKQSPNALYGKAERLMTEFMEAVYRRIRNKCSALKDDNHIVYIARPSGWTQKEKKDLYCQMALHAGIPLAGLTSESRAAIFYAKVAPHISFEQNISNGAIVFDLGSSTLDFTYLSDTVQPTDFGYNLGASMIDRAIYSKLILASKEVQDFVKEFPAYEDALLFKARKFKEEAYGRKEDSKTISQFTLEAILPPEDSAFDKYGEVFVKLKITNLQELNNIVEEETHYQDRLRKALTDFQNTRIKNAPVNGVFLTGGASRMNFIKPLIAETLSLPLEKVKIDGDNPSLTISRGIALLGVTDAITTNLIKKLKDEIHTKFNDTKFITGLVETLSNGITNATWNVLEQTTQRWIRIGESTDEEELKRWLQDGLNTFKKEGLNDEVKKILTKFFQDESEYLRKELNKIISQYAPGREISTSALNYHFDSSSITAFVAQIESAISEVCDSITSTLGDILGNILMAALGWILFGPWIAAWYLFRMLTGTRTDADIRKEKADKLFEKKEDITTKLKNQLRSDLSQNASFTTKIKPFLSSHFTKMINANLNKVMIPIE